MSVHVPADLARLPFDGVDMEIGNRGFGRQPIRVADMRVGRPTRTEMERTEHPPRFLAAGFHEIDLAGGSPGTVPLGLRQHPDSRPESRADGQPRPDLKPPITLAEQGVAVFASGFQPRRAVTTTVQGFFQRADMQVTVPDESIVRCAGVILELAVAPTADPLVGVVGVEPVADIEIPFRAVDRVTVKLIAPGQLPPGRGCRGSVTLGGASRPGHRDNRQGEEDPTAVRLLLACRGKPTARVQGFLHPGFRRLSRPRRSIPGSARRSRARCSRRDPWRRTPR